MKKHKSNKLLLWLSTFTLAVGFTAAVVPSSFEEEVSTSAESMVGEVNGTTFFDDFSRYESYGNKGVKGEGINLRSGAGWTNEYFDGVDGSTTDFGTGCTNKYASITVAPDDPSNKVLYLNTNKDENSFFYITPMMNGSQLVLRNYEISFRFMVLTSTKSEDRSNGAPWFGTINRKVNQGSKGYVPKDGRYNGTFNFSAAFRAGRDVNEANSTPNYFFSFSELNKNNTPTPIELEGQKGENGKRAALDNCVYPATVYDEWHVYKCVVNEETFDMYLDGKHMGGFDMPNTSGFSAVRNNVGYLSIALCVADIYVDNVNIREILPGPAIDGSSESSMRLDRTKDENFSFANTKTITAIKKGTEVLAATAYAYDNGKLTIKKSYIDTLGVGKHVFTVTANDGVKDFEIDITINVLPVPGVEGDSNQVSLLSGSSAKIKLNNVDRVDSVLKNSKEISSKNYSYDATTKNLTFTDAYISTLTVGTHEFIVNTNNEEFILKLTIQAKPKVSGSSQQVVSQGQSVTFTLENVSSISEILYNNEPIDATDYSYENGVLTFKDSYTQKLTKGAQAHVIKTSAGDLKVTLFITVSTGGDVDYVEGDSTVTVKYNQDAVFTLKNVDAINSITADTELEIGEDYTYDGSKLTIKSSYIEGLDAGEYTFIVDLGNDDIFQLKINYTPAVISSSSSATATFEKDLAPIVKFTFDNVESITSIVRLEELNKAHYTFTDGELSFASKYLKELPCGVNKFVVTTDNGEVEVSIIVTGEVTLKLLIPENSKASFAEGETGIKTFEEGENKDVVVNLSGIPADATIMIQVSENKKLSSAAYSYENNTLTFKGDYIKTLLAGTKELTLVVTIPTTDNTSDDTTDTGSTNNKPSQEQNTEEEGGCGSSLGFAGTMMAAAVVGGIAMARKKKRK